MTEALLGRLEPKLDRIERKVDESGASRIVWVETGEREIRRRSDEPEVSVWQRLRVWWFGLLPIESQL